MAVFDTYAQGTPNWVELSTPDQRGAAEFYGALFGWQMVENPLDDGHVYIVGNLHFLLPIAFLAAVVAWLYLIVGLLNEADASAEGLASEIGARWFSLGSLVIALVAFFFAVSLGTWKSVRVAVDVQTLGREYLVVLDAYRSEAEQAGASFIEIQNTMLFATVGQRSE